ncbi:hypothetical protein BDV95DRAFT_80365 [Massariosphaeria phaeospora]|uniref:Uncharacterized protein n=1 Tax=Massariosphaeria phaeospora TaxID=100035 RepID=A0A7C8M6Y9_9PLEO|nr:hypothetical protein BDV95DRAFT_80365 [Massariosphaeria phaeospora]
MIFARRQSAIRCSGAGLRASRRPPSQWAARSDSALSVRRRAGALAEGGGVKWPGKGEDGSSNGGGKRVAVCVAVTGTLHHLHASRRRPSMRAAYRRAWRRLSHRAQRGWKAGHAIIGTQMPLVWLESLSLQPWWLWSLGGDVSLRGLAECFPAA